MCSLFTHKEIPYDIRKDQVLSFSPARQTYKLTELTQCTSGDPNLEQFR